MDNFDPYSVLLCSLCCAQKVKSHVDLQKRYLIVYRMISLYIVYYYYYVYHYDYYPYIIEWTLNIHCIHLPWYYLHYGVAMFKILFLESIWNSINAV